MTRISERLQQLRLGDTQAYLNLAIVPLLGDGAAAPGYRLLDDALTFGCATVSEVSAEGSVPELRFQNRCERPVLLLDGEELVGAKQNRILNLSVLAPAGKDIVIPVSCVEQGRWHQTSPTFASARRTHFSRGRANKTAQVSFSLRTRGTRDSDQGAVWDDIADMSMRLDAPSDTHAAAALYDRHKASLEAYRQAFSPVHGQLGAIFMINGRSAGVELFDSAITLATLLPKLVESYALDAVDLANAAGRGAEGDDPAALLMTIGNGETASYPAVGLGDDWRVTAPGVSAAALVWEDRVVHLCAFVVPSTANDDERHAGGLARASLRSRRFRWL
jgi:hypothetical protein